MKVSPATLSRAAEKLRSYGELKLADALAPRKSLKEPKSRRPAKVEREGKRAATKELHSEVRAQAVVRSEGSCESFLAAQMPYSLSVDGWVRCSRPAVEHDHFFGRARDKTVFGSWMQCRSCATAKTLNSPSRVYWLHSFLIHLKNARLHDFDWRRSEAYTERARKVKSLIALEEAQHPSRTPEST